MGGASDLGGEALQRLPLSPRGLLKRADNAVSPRLAIPMAPLAPLGRSLIGLFLSLAGRTGQLNIKKTTDGGLRQEEQRDRRIGVGRTNRRVVLQIPTLKNSENAPTIGSRPPAPGQSYSTSGSKL